MVRKIGLSNCIFKRRSKQYCSFAARFWLIYVFPHYVLVPAAPRSHRHVLPTSPLHLVMRVPCKCLYFLLPAWNVWIHVCGFHLFCFTTQGGGTNLFHTPTSITKQLRIEAILRQMEMLMVTAHKQESHICEIMKWVGSCYMNSMSVGIFSWL